MPESLKEKLEASAEAAIEGAAKGASEVLDSRLAGGPVPITSRNVGISAGISALIAFLRRLLKRK